MKILLLSHKFNPDIGGIESHSENLANYLSEKGEEIRLVTWSIASEEEAFFSYKVIRNPSLFQLLQEFSWAEMIFENNPTLKLSWLNHLFWKPHIIVLHTWIRRSNGKIALKDKLKLNYLRKADAVIAVSKKLGEATFKKAIIINNGYNQFLFRRNKEITKNRDFVFLGRLVSDKGADMAIKLIKKLNDEKTNKFTLSIIGDGEEKTNLEALVKGNNLEEWVEFTGVLSKENLVEKLNEHKYILIPSRWKEPFGLVALEGMACGCLPIVSKGGGLPEAIGKAGVVFNRNNQADFLRTVKKLLDSPKLESSIRSAMPAHLKKHHMETISNEYHQIIKKLKDEKYQVNPLTSHR